jgi:outer membrane protein assembly factor BamA
VTNSRFGHLFPVVLLGFVIAVSNVAFGTDSFTLSAVHLVGTNRLTTDDVIRGLDLKLGGATTQQDILHACDRFQQLKLFDSSRCQRNVKGRDLTLTILVNDKWPETPVVFDNFVWTTQHELLARLKHDLPLFMPELPIRSGLTNDIIRVLTQVAAEHGIKSKVEYDDRFWTDRGMNLFFIEGISTPVRSFQIEGENPPPPADVLRFSEFYTKEDFSTARLTWITHFVIRDLYAPRGYLRAKVQESLVQPLAEKDGTYPVRVILHISSGALFTFDSVRFEGLAKEHSAALLAKWTLIPGAPYDPAYVNKFTYDEILSAPWVPYSKTYGSSASPCAMIDEASKRVSLTITVEAPKKSSTDHAVSSDNGCHSVGRIDLHPHAP